jgi:spermidine synthase
MRRLVAWLADRGRQSLTVSPKAIMSAMLAPLGRGWAKTLYEKDTGYHRIRVEETRERRYLYFDGTLQSSMDRRDPASLELLYSRFTSLGLVLRPDAAKALIIGLGGGSMAKKYHKEFPEIEIDSIEIDPDVVEVARKFFHFQEDSCQRVHGGDGREFLTRADDRFDLILLDAYYADNMPFHLVTREFFGTARRKMTPEGVLVINLIGSLRGPDSAMIRAAIKTLSSVFPQVYIFPTFGNRGHVLTEIQNVVVLASNALERMSMKEMERRAIGLGRDLFPDPVSKIRSSYYSGPLEQDDVELLTDDAAPLDNLVRL